MRLLILLTLSCATTVTRPTTDAIRATLETETISTQGRKVISAQLDDYDRQVKALADEYDKLLKEYNELQEAHQTLQNQFVEASRDAGVKDTLVGGFWGLIAILGMLTALYILYLISKNKLKIPFLT